MNAGGLSDLLQRDSFSGREGPVRNAFAQSESDHIDAAWTQCLVTLSHHLLRICYTLERCCLHTACAAYTLRSFLNRFTKK
jgi:hypothetical protein